MTVTAQVGVTDGAASPASWGEHTVDVHGRTRTYRSAGAGDPVLILDPASVPTTDPITDSALPEPFAPLAACWLLIAPTPSLAAPDDGAADVHRSVTSLVDLLTALDITRCHVVARGTAAAAALWLAAEHADLIGTLVLESPALAAAGAATEVDAPLFGMLAMIDAPTLVLLGQRTEQAAPGRTGVFKRLPGSTIGLVYDAGADIRADRPSAYTAAVADYLERGQAFVVNIRSSVING